MRGTLEVGLKAYLHARHQHCNDEAQKAETVLSAVSSEQWAVSSEQWAVSSEQWAVSSEQWAVSSEQWAVSSGQWAVSSEQLQQALCSASECAKL